MTVLKIGQLGGAAVVTMWALVFGPAPTVPAVPPAPDPSCPDVEAVFARGTTEAPGVGSTGEAFVEALRSRIGPKSMRVYAVDYPATMDFPTALDGINDAGLHIQQTVATCPNTKMVLGGYSQGAAVMGFVTSAAVPDDAPEGAPKPLSPEVADHAAAVTLFGTPSPQFMASIGAPPIVIGPLYAAKTLELCAPGDPVCAGGGDWAAHDGYPYDGTVDQAANFAVSRL